MVVYMCVDMFQCASWKENDEIHEKKDDSVPLEYLFLHVCSLKISKVESRLFPSSVQAAVTLMLTVLRTGRVAVTVRGTCCILLAHLFRFPAASLACARVWIMVLVMQSPQPRAVRI